MFIRLLIIGYLCLQQRQIWASSSSSSCPYIRRSMILTDCQLDTSVYLSLGAQIFNTNSVDWIGYYALNSTENRINDPLIYHLGHRWMFVLPLLLKCADQAVHLTFTECQYTMRQSKSSIVEYMSTQLSVMNMTHLGMQSVLFLQPGEITLRSCKAYDCSKQLVYLTASNETFNFRINYEKSIGTKCQSNIDCSHRYAMSDLLHCDPLSQTCQCLDENITTIELTNIGRLCTDSIDRSNCTKNPQRCLQWCDQSRTSHCICPRYTRKVRKINGRFDCELEPTGICRFDDEEEIGLNIRKCPTGTICESDRCQSLTKFRQMYEALPDPSTTPESISFSATFNHPPANFVRVLVIIALASLLFCILIIFIIAMLIKTRRFPLSSSSEDKVSSSSFIHSTPTSISNEIYQFKPQSILSYDYSSARPTFLPGLVPRANLSPRFYRPYPEYPRRTPAFPCTTNQRIHFPTVTHLQNGDVIISA